MAPAGINDNPLDAGKAIYTAITIMIAIAWYNLLELNFLIFATFKRYRGLYFWSLLISSWGTFLHGLGFVLKFFQAGTSVYFDVAVITVGWYCMVTGQSIVLYSRIHIVLQQPKVLRRVLIMIIVDAILFHIPTTILTFGANSSDAAVFTFPYEIMEKIQMTAFSFQELVISAIYMHAALKLFRPLYHEGDYKPMVELLLINIIIIAMDITLLAVEYESLYDLEVSMKTLIYSIKLKLEFAVLTELKSYANPGRSRSFSTHRRSTIPHQSQVFGQSFVEAPAHQPAMLCGGVVKTASADVTSDRDDGFILPSGHVQQQTTRRNYHLQNPSIVSRSSSETELAPYLYRQQQRAPLDRDTSRLPFN